nr:hypothetical protein REQ54_01759 [Rhizobium sp. Q54]
MTPIRNITPSLLLLLSRHEPGLFSFPTAEIRENEGSAKNFGAAAPDHPRINGGFRNPLIINNTAPISARLFRDYQAEIFKKISGSWQRPFNGRSTAVQRLGAPWAQGGRRSGAGIRLVPLALSAWATQARRSRNARKALDLLGFHESPTQGERTANAAETQSETQTETRFSLASLCISLGFGLQVNRIETGSAMGLSCDSHGTGHGTTSGAGRGA